MRQLAGDVLRLAVAAVFVAPLVIVTFSALRDDRELFQFATTLSWNTFVPKRFTGSNLSAAVDRPMFTRQILNTFVVAGIQATLTVLLAIPTAFALARMRFRGRGLVFAIVLIGIYIPFEAIVVPLFQIVQRFGLLDSHIGVIVPWVASPVAVFLLRQAMQDLPVELDEAAILDGANLRQILTRVTVPNIGPAIVTVWLITVIYVVDSFLWPLVVLSTPSKQLAQVGIAQLFNPVNVEYGVVFASALLTAAPAVILFMALQRFYRRSLTTSGLK